MLVSGSHWLLIFEMSWGMGQFFGVTFAILSFFMFNMCSFLLYPTFLNRGLFIMYLSLAHVNMLSKPQFSQVISMYCCIFFLRFIVNVVPHLVTRSLHLSTWSNEKMDLSMYWFARDRAFFYWRRGVKPVIVRRWIVEIFVVVVIIVVTSYHVIVTNNWMLKSHYGLCNEHLVM